jgi:hypothetical protein
VSVREARRIAPFRETYSTSTFDATVVELAEVAVEARALA